jgi:hypothetical protein
MNASKASARCPGNRFVVNGHMPEMVADQLLPQLPKGVVDITQISPVYPRPVN